METESILLKLLSIALVAVAFPCIPSFPCITIVLPTLPFQRMMKMWLSTCTNTVVKWIRSCSCYSSPLDKLLARALVTLRPLYDHHSLMMNRVSFQSYRVWVWKSSLQTQWRVHRQTPMRMFGTKSPGMTRLNRYLIRNVFTERTLRTRLFSPSNIQRNIARLPEKRAKSVTPEIAFILVTHLHCLAPSYSKVLQARARLRLLDWLLKRAMWF